MLNYIIPEESPWHVEKGAYGPKYITAAITYQVIHDKVPGLKKRRMSGDEADYDFYGQQQATLNTTG